MLPKTRSVKKNELSDMTILVYGPTKIGKSTMCNDAESALFLATEPGLNSLEAYSVTIDSWDDMLSACKDIAGGKHDFKTIVIDTIDNAYKLCSEYVCKKNKVEHESDLGYGKGYTMINNEFLRVLKKLAFLPYGLIMISHSQVIEIKTRTGARDKTVSSLPKKARLIATGLADIVLLCDAIPVKDSSRKTIYKRVVHAKSNPNDDAGDRTGRLPAMIELDFKKIKAAFDGGAKTKKEK